MDSDLLGGKNAAYYEGIARWVPPPPPPPPAPDYSNYGYSGGGYIRKEDGKYYTSNGDGTYSRGGDGSHGTISIK